MMAIGSKVGEGYFRQVAQEEQKAWEMRRKTTCGLEKQMSLEDQHSPDEGQNRWRVGSAVEDPQHGQSIGNCCVSE